MSWPRNKLTDNVFKEPLRNIVWSNLAWEQRQVGIRTKPARYGIDIRKGPSQHQRRASSRLRRLCHHMRASAVPELRTSVTWNKQVRRLHAGVWWKQRRRYVETEDSPISRVIRLLHQGILAIQYAALSVPPPR